MITAVVLSASSYPREWPGIKVLVRTQQLRRADDFHCARLAAIEAVRTDHFFFLDDDDDLPADYLDVLAECVSAGRPLAYTDEIVDGEVRRSAPYSQDAHLRSALLVHHLALYQTDAARAAVKGLPHGHYYPEMMLAWEVAKGGAAYVPRVGYVWNRAGGGQMHARPSSLPSQVRTALWCKEHP